MGRRERPQVLDHSQFLGNCTDSFGCFLKLMSTSSTRLSECRLSLWHKARFCGCSQATVASPQKYPVEFTPVFEVSLFGSSRCKLIFTRLSEWAFSVIVMPGNVLGWKWMVPLDKRCWLVEYRGELRVGCTKGCRLVLVRTRNNQMLKVCRWEVPNAMNKPAIKCLASN